ncbi:MAG: hypothetical protein JJU06_01050 [Ectothiorhodospiraceae bacterium]|nr:hypothetical protein [Ectothiorhodospiraceae bacterium]
MKRWLALSLVTCIVVATVIVAWSAFAQAGVRAVYSTDFGLLTVEVLDRRHVRLNSDDALELLITDGEGYVLRRQGDAWLIMPLSELLAITGTHAVQDSDIRLLRTDQTEKVAGYTGSLYRVESRKTADEDWAPSGELVLSDDPATRQLGAAFAAIAELVGGHPSVLPLIDGTENTLALEDYGLLRYDQIRLQSTSRVSLQARHFRLPAGVSLNTGGKPKPLDSVLLTNDASHDQAAVR